MKKVSAEDLAVLIQEVQASRDEAFPHHTLQTRDLQSVLAELVELRSAPKMAPVTVEISSEMITHVIQEELQKILREEQQPGGMLCPGVRSDAEMIKGMADASDSGLDTAGSRHLDGYLHCVCELLRNEGNTDEAIEHASNLLARFQDIPIPVDYALKVETRTTLEDYGLLEMVE